MPPNDIVPLAEILQLNGYSTAHFGKCYMFSLDKTAAVGSTPEHRFATTTRQARPRVHRHHLTDPAIEAQLAMSRQ